MLPVLIDTLLLVLRSFIAVSLNRLKIKRITLIRFNRLDATAEEIELAKEISKNVSDKRGTPSQQSVMKASDQLEFGERGKVTERANILEQEMLEDQEENLRDMAIARGIGFISNKTPYTSSENDITSSLIGFAKEEGENFVIGTAANSALVASAAATGGAATVIGVGVDLTLTAVREEMSKLSEEEEDRKEKYVQESEGDVLMLSRSAKKRIREEALARANSESQDANNKSDKSTMVAGGPEWNAKKKLLDNSITTLKWLLRVVDFAFAVLTTVLIAIAIITAITALILLAVVSFAASSLGVDVDYSKADTKSDTGTSQSPVKEESKGGSTAVPEGIDPNSWNTASNWGKRVASEAIRSSTMTLDVPGTQSNNKHLVYQQGNTPVGVYDCSVFVAAIYESLGKTTTGGDKTGGNYDFKTNKKSDLQTYLTTTGLNAFFAGKQKENIGTVFVGDWESKIQPGDMVLLSGHVGIYVGKNLAGTHMMAHAGSPSAQVYYDTAFKNPGTQVGLGYLGFKASDWSSQMLIIRPHVDFK